MSSKSRLDRSDKLAVLAVLLSFLAVTVSFYEANVLKEQQEIMQAQQKASVWPYVQAQLSFEYSDKLWVRIYVENKGVGPALIRSSDFYMNGNTQGSYTEIYDALASYFPDSADMGLSLNGLEGAVLSPGEKVNVIEIQCNHFLEGGKVLRSLALEQKLCYCSIYDECWAISSNSSDHTAVQACGE